MVFLTLIFISILPGKYAFAQAAPESPSPVAEETLAAPSGAPELAPVPAESLPADEPTVASPVEAGIPVTASGHLRTTRTKIFNKPVYFDPSEENILAHPTISYRMTPTMPGALQLGPVEISEKTFYVEYKTFNELLGVKPAKGVVQPPKSLFIAWPDALFTQGRIEIISQGGRVVWKKDFSNEKLDDFTRWINKQKAPVGVAPQALVSLKRELRFKIDSLERETVWMAENPAFRICISQTKGPFFSRLCTRTLRTRAVGKSVVLGKIKMDGQPRLLINNEPKGFVGRQEVSFKQNISFSARIPSGESYEYFTRPINIDLADFSQNPLTGVVELVGFDNFPFAKYEILNKKVYSEFIASIGFEQTIVDPRRFWRTTMKVGESEISFPGSAGGVFSYIVNTDAFPRFQARPHLEKDTREGTYKDNVRLFGRKQPASTITSTQNSILTFEEDPTRFDWYYQALKPAQYNQSEIQIDYEGKSYKAYYEMYRGYANEISARLTGIPANGSLVFLSEAAYNIWFEDFLWLNKAKWAKQTVGLSTRYFQSLIPINVKNGNSVLKSHLTVWTGDLKYRLNPGLWTRDETMGAMFSYQSVAFAEVTAAMVGPGWFWARSMPRVFDEFLNLFPFMNYPKWVDMELIYYAKSFNPNVELIDNMALNFHGQVLWKPNFFGEAGFGIRRLGFGLTNENTKPELTILYGTVGIGYKF